MIPLILPNGVIIVYGWGTKRDGSEGLITPTSQEFVFGFVYKIWDGGAVFVYNGDEVMWKQGNEQCQLAFGGSPYTQIECRLVTKQILSV